MRAWAPYNATRTVLSQNQVCAEVTDAPCDAQVVGWQVKSIYHLVAQQMEVQNTAIGSSKSLLHTIRCTSQELKKQRSLQLVHDLKNKNLRKYQNDFKISSTWLDRIEVGQVTNTIWHQIQRALVDLWFVTSIGGKKVCNCDPVSLEGSQGEKQLC